MTKIFPDQIFPDFSTPVQKFHPIFHFPVQKFSPVFLLPPKTRMRLNQTNEDDTDFSVTIEGNKIDVSENKTDVSEDKIDVCESNMDNSDKNNDDQTSKTCYCIRLNS